MGDGWPALRVLGPIEIGPHHGAPGPRVGGLLALLLARRDQRVRVETLVDELWNGRPPPTARSALRTHVTAARRVLATAGLDNALHAGGSSYQLVLPHGAVDIDMLARARADADRLADDPVAAFQLLAAARRVVRGRPYEDVEDVLALRPEIERLASELDGFEEQRLRLGLAAGRHLELLSDVQHLAAQHPLDERFTKLLMVALFRAGRQADALRAYERLRSTLAEELGLVPTPELRALEQQVLDQTLPPAAVAAPAAPRSSGRAAPPLVHNARPPVGRARELVALDALAERSRTAARGAFALVEGEAGIGKSRLVGWFARTQWECGYEVLVGVCERDDAAPYQPLVELTDAARVASPTAPDPFAGLDGHDPAGARYRLFERFRSLLAERASHTSVVVLLEDLHWADPSTLALLRYLCRCGIPARCLVVGTVRAEPDATDATAEVRALDALERIALDDLAPDAVADLVAELRPGWAPRDVATAADRVRALAGGNPLLVASALDLDHDDLGDGHDGSSLGAPALLATRLQSVSAQGREILAVAALVGARVRVDDVTAFVGAGDDTGHDRLVRVIDGLDEGARAGVVRPTGPSSYEFVHDLFRMGMLRGFPAGQRRMLHRRVGLARRAAGASAGEVAMHLCRAVPLVEPGEAIAAAERAAAESIEELAFEDAARLYRLALELADDAGLSGRQRCDLLCRLGSALDHTADAVGARLAFQAGFELAAEAGDVELLARAALGTGGHGEPLADDPARLELLRRALALVDASHPELRAPLLADLAYRGSTTGVTAECEALVGELEADAGARPELERWLLLGRLSLLLPSATAVERDAVAARFVQLMLKDPAHGLPGLALSFRVHSLLHLGRVDDADDHVQQLWQLADRFGRPADVWGARVMRSCVAELRGDIAEAEHWCRDAQSVGHRLDIPDCDAAVALYRFSRAWKEGRLGVDDNDLAGLAYPTNPAISAGLEAAVALGMASSGDLSGAVAVLEAAVPRLLSIDREIFWMPSVCVAAAAVARAGARHLAPPLRRALDPFAGQYAVAGLTCATVLGPVDEFLAALG